MNKIKQARKNKRLTGRELARAVSLTPASISKIERGLVGVSPATARKLAIALDLTVEDVLFPEEKAA